MTLKENKGNTQSTHIDKYMEWLEHGRQFSKNTLRDVRGDLETFDGNLDEALRFQFEQYVVKENKRGMASATVNRRISTMRNYMQWLIDNDLRSGKNPVSKHMTPRVRHEHHKSIGKELLDELYESANKDVKYAIALMGYAGFRIGEVANLDNYYYDANGILAAHLKDTKGGKERHVSLALVPDPELIKTVIDNGGLQGQRGRRTANSIWRIVKAHVGKTTPHDLRATFSTMLVENDVNVAVVRDMLGHTDLQGETMTSRYVSTTPVEKQAKELMEVFG